MPDTIPVPEKQPNKANIQGLILRGYTHPCSVHMLFNFSNAVYVPGFFKALLPYLRSADDWGAEKPEIMVNIGLTANGIKKISSKLKTKLDLSAFPPDFVVGPQGSNPGSTPNPQASLRDYGEGSPANWWNKKFSTTDIHCVVHAYAMNYDSQARIVEIITAAAAKSNGFISELLPLESGSGRLEQYPFLPYNHVHFSYVDSINEPALNLDPVTRPVPPPAPAPKTLPDNSKLRNFLIGYDEKAAPGPVNGPEGEFARDGCYNAFRILYQDVAAFNDFIEEQAVIIAPQIGKPVEYTKEWLAAKINGRWRNGSPLANSPHMPDQKTVEDKDFTFEDDKTGLKCPFSAHTRVANPRGQQLSGSNSALGVPHLIRRGMPYGAPLSKNNAHEDRGLIGLFLCGDLASQFQKLYDWINTNNFSPSNIFPFPQNTQDALIANRAAYSGKIDNSFTIEMGEGKQPIKILELPQFVVTRGTAYFLLPSISSIKQIAEAK